MLSLWLSCFALDPQAVLRGGEEEKPSCLALTTERLVQGHPLSLFRAEGEC